MRRSHRRPPDIRVAHNQLSAERLLHSGTGLLTDEHSAQVVPGREGSPGAVDEGVDLAGRDGTQIQSGGPQDPVLRPAEPLAGVAGQGHDGLAHRPARRRGDRAAVGARPAAPGRLEAHAGGLIGYDRSEGTVGVDGAGARRPPGNAAGRVRRAVDGIEHHPHRPIGVVQTRFLRERSEPGPLDDRQGNPICDQVAAVLAVAGTGQTPVVQVLEALGHSRDHLVEDGQDLRR